MIGITTEGAVTCEAACYNSDLNLGGESLRKSLFGKSSIVAGFCRSASGFPAILAANEENLCWVFWEPHPEHLVSALFASADWSRVNSFWQSSQKYS